MNSNQINNVKSVEDFEIKNDHSNEIVRKNPAFYAENTLQVIKRISKDLGMALEKLGGQLCFDIYKKNGVWFGSGRRCNDELGRGCAFCIRSIIIYFKPIVCKSFM